MVQKLAKLLKSITRKREPDTVQEVPQYVIDKCKHEYMFRPVVVEIDSRPAHTIANWDRGGIYWQEDPYIEFGTYI